MIDFNQRWKTHIKEIEYNPSNLQVKDNLHPDFWQKGRLNQEAMEKLRQIVDDVVEMLEIPVKIKDVTITGSIAAYNWHALSDVDLHILLDFREIDENFDLIKDYLDSKRINWNKAHKIMIFGHEVELYFQDINEEHHSSGAYSILGDDWIKEPVKQEVEMDLSNAEKKADAISREIDHVSELFHDRKYKEAYEFSDKIKIKLRKLRSSGLEREGIYSAENLAFKILRNERYLEKLSSLKVMAYDLMMSVSGKSKIKIKIMEKWSKFRKNVSI
mgnify:CR=1 FL=1|jgi:predicted nucleotidyltransferase